MNITTVIIAGAHLRRRVLEVLAFTAILATLVAVGSALIWWA